MRLNNEPIAFVSLVLIGSVAPALAAGPAGTIGPDQDWVLRVGGEIGQDQSRASTASLDYKKIAGAPTSTGPSPSWSGGISGLHTDAPTQSGSTVTTGGAIYVHYGTDAVSGGLAFDSTQDEGFRRSPRWTATLDLAGHGFTSELSLSTRRTTFDNFSAWVPGAASRFSESGYVNTSASCDARDTGYGLNLGYSAAGWSGFIAGTGSHFDSISCGYGLASSGLVSRFDRGGFQQIAGSFVNQAAARAGGRIGQDTRLLESSVGAGVSRQWERAALAFDYTHTKDELGGALQDGYAVTGSAKLTTLIAAELTLGTTVADSHSTPYVGAYLSVGW